MPEFPHFFFHPDWPASATAPISAQIVTCIGASLTGDPAECCRQLHSHTTITEQQRAAVFVQPVDAARHLLGRAMLRAVLARELGPRALPEAFPCTPWGKPGLPGSGFEFSISHAGNAVWLAITRHTPLGIDVEATDACHDPCLLADALHDDERDEILSCNTTQEASQLFLRCWTRKEAVIKALGLGVSCPLDSFRVATDTRTANWLQDAPPGHDGPWTCSDLPCPADYHVSLAAMASGLTLTCHALGLPDARLPFP